MLISYHSSTLRICGAWRPYEREFLHLGFNIQIKLCILQSNVLINEGGQACLTDFGLSSMMKIGERFEYLRLNEKRPGAVHWSAPELIPDPSRIDEDGERYMPSTSSDIYSYGCIMYEVSMPRPSTLKQTILMLLGSFR
jgi:serine/threonine protein kinase